MSFDVKRYSAIATLLLLAACTPEAPPATTSQEDTGPVQSSPGVSGMPGEPSSARPAEEPMEPLMPTEVSADAIALGSARDESGSASSAKPVYSTSDTIHASVPMRGITPGAKLDAYWTYQDGQTHKMDSQTALSAEFATFTFSSADGLRAGNYNVQIDANGVPLGIVEFRVE